MAYTRKRCNPYVTSNETQLSDGKPNIWDEKTSYLILKNIYAIIIPIQWKMCQSISYLVVSCIDLFSPCAKSFKAFIHGLIVPLLQGVFLIMIIGFILYSYNPTYLYTQLFHITKTKREINIAKSHLYVHNIRHNVILICCQTNVKEMMSLLIYRVIYEARTIWHTISKENILHLMKAGNSLRKYASITSCITSFLWSKVFSIS